MKQNELSGHLSAFITILIWGTTFISTKLLLDDLTPVAILCLRFLIGYIALWIAHPHPLHIQNKKQELYFMLAGLCGVTLYFLLENIALTYTQASNVGVIISIAPFFTFLFTYLFLHVGHPTLRFFAGFILALCGITMISFGNASSFEINPIGDLLAFAAAIIWAAYSTITKKISEFGYHTIKTTRRTFFYGLIFMVPVISIMDVSFEFSIFLDMKLTLNLLYLGLGASALCFVTWNQAVKLLGSVKTSVYIYLVPIITTITSFLILHELMTWQMIIGILLTLIGLFLSEDRRHTKECKNNDITE